MVLDCCVAALALTSSVVNVAGTTANTAVPLVFGCIPTQIFIEEQIPNLNEEYAKKEFEDLMSSHEEGKQMVIGVTGPVGVGKTVLLQRYNNQFRGCLSTFKVVIFVEDVSRTATSLNNWIHKVQNQIKQRLKITFSDDTGNDGDPEYEEKNRSRATTIREILQKSNFVIIIDNVMPDAEPRHVGLLTDNNGNTTTYQRRIVYSARDTSPFEAEWQGKGGPKTIKLSEMDKTASKKLFESACGSKLNTNVMKTAGAILQPCGNLPGPIIYLANIMAPHVDRLETWQDYREKCMSSTKILQTHIEKLNYCLNTAGDDKPEIKESLRSLFLFCSLFSPDDFIRKKDLISYCISEDDTRNVQGGIESLINIHFLQSDDKHMEEMVKVTYAFRQPSLKIEEQENEGSTRVIIEQKSDEFLKSLRKICHQVWRASLSQCNDMEKLDVETLECPLLKTLIISHCDKLNSISDGFFGHMPKLRVLDLSYTSITEISPGICKLVSLVSLNLSNTRITKLPPEMKQLENLENLYLENTNDLRKIHDGDFSHLATKLVVLKMNASFNSWASIGVQNVQASNRVDIHRLEGFTKLTYLAITINSQELLQVFVDSNKLSRFTKHLHINEYSKSSIDITPVLDKIPKLERLSITSSTRLSELTIDENELNATEDPDLTTMLISNLDLSVVKWTTNLSGKLTSLSSLIITDCKELTHVSWVLRIPQLKYLSISRCIKLTQLIEERLESNKALSFLRKMTLDTLYGLTSICRADETINFKSLESLCVMKCSNLVQLPLSIKPPEKLKIQGERSWWNQLKWGRKIGLFMAYNPNIFSAIDDVPAGCAQGQAFCSYCCP